jgi:putative ABC transport system substrate-binding protein
MRRRRDFLLKVGALAVIVALAPQVACAQKVGRTYRIGVLAVYPRGQARLDPFFDELRTRGFVEGANLLVDYWFEPDIDRLDSAAAGMVTRAPDAIIGYGPVVVRAMENATKTIPILAWEPVAGRETLSLARRGSNKTGVSFFVAELNGKRQEILMEVLPSARHIAVLADPNVPQSLEAVTAAASARGVQLSVYSVATPEEIDVAIDAAKKTGAEGLNVLSSPMFYATRETIYGAAARARLPAIYEWSFMAEQGGLIGYGARTTLLHRQLARQTAEVLNGAKPADIPIEQATTFDLALNLKTAKALGIEIPGSILARADEVIE